MKTILILTTIIFWSFAVNAASGVKTYKKTFDKGQVSELVISNRYGRVELEKSTDGKINITADVHVGAKLQTKVDEILEYIFIVDNVTDYHISVETIFKKDMTIKQMVSGIEMEIVYKVQVPDSVNVRIVNKDGDVVVGNFGGNLNVDLRNGNFTAGTLTGEEVKLIQIGNTCTVENVAVMKGEFQGAKIDIKSAKSLDLNISNCQSTLGSISDLTIGTYAGNVKIENVDALRGTISATKFEVMDVSDAIDVTMKGGELNTGNINQHFSMINVKGTNSRVGLTFATRCSFILDLKYNKAVQMDLAYDDKPLKLETMPTGEKGIFVKSGVVGKSDNSVGSKVTLDLRGGSMYIQ